MMHSIEFWIALPPSVVAFAVALVKIIKWGVNLSHTMREISALASHELNHNSGSSVKDAAFAAKANSQTAVRIASETNQAVQGFASQFSQFLVNYHAEQNRVRDEIDELKEIVNGAAA